MSPTRRRTALLPALVTAIVPLAAGCGAGNNATTQNFYAPADGVNIVQGEVRVLNALVVGPEAGGSEGTVSMTIANDGLQPDTLREITSDAGEVEIQGPREIPAKGSLSFAGPTASSSALIRGFTRKGGEAVALTLAFERNGTVSNLRTIVVPPEGYYRGFQIRPTSTSLPSTEVSAPAPPSPSAGFGGGGAFQGQSPGPARTGTSAPSPAAPTTQQRPMPAPSPS